MLSVVVSTIGLHCSLICLSVFRQPIGETTHSVHVKLRDVLVVSNFWPSLFDFMSCLLSLGPFFFLIRHLFNFSTTVTSLTGISFPLFSFATPCLQTQLPLCPLTFRSHYFCRFLYPKKGLALFLTRSHRLCSCWMRNLRIGVMHQNALWTDGFHQLPVFFFFFFFSCCRGDSLASVLLIYLRRRLGSRHRKLNYAPNWCTRI